MVYWWGWGEGRYSHIRRIGGPPAGESTHGGVSPEKFLGPRMLHFSVVNDLTAFLSKLEIPKEFQEGSPI
jgi:hypothetical protein